MTLVSKKENLPSLRAEKKDAKRLFFVVFIASKQDK